jgi:hypothetical protein
LRNNETTSPTEHAALTKSGLLAAPTTSSSAAPPMRQPSGFIRGIYYLQSSLREKLLEHVFVGELLRCLWRNNRRDVEVLRAEIDSSGYDLVLECNGMLRHVQFKSSHRDARTRKVNIHVNLAKKRAGA